MNSTCTSPTLKAGFACEVEVEVGVPTTPVPVAVAAGGSAKT